MEQKSFKHILISIVILFVLSVSFLSLALYLDRSFESYRPIVERPESLRPSPSNPAAVIDTSSDDGWVYFNFSTGSVVKINDRSSLDWDLAFMRKRIISNSGRTNPQGKAGIINLGVRNIDAIDKAPDGDYMTDTLEEGKFVNKAIEKWYEYSVMRHTLTSKGDLYIIRSGDKYAKMKILGYYCGGKSGCYTIEYVYPFIPGTARN